MVEPKQAVAKMKCPRNESRSLKKPGGWLTKEEKKAMIPRKPGSDTEHDFGGDDRDPNNTGNLVDWEGNWLPAPVEWEGRIGFRRINYYESIADWVDVANMFALHKQNPTAPKKILDVTAEEFMRDQNNLEFAPRAWIPDVVDAQTLQTYWRNLQQSDLKVLDEEDSKLPPFWLLYCSNESDFQISLHVPDAFLDPKDEEKEKGMYLKGKSYGRTALEIIKDNERQKSKTEKEKKLAEREAKRARREARREPQILPPPNPNRPKVNIYLRPAEYSDVHQIISIYNWQIEQTCHVSDLVPWTVQEMQSFLNKIDDNRLPVVVAIQKSSNKPVDNRDVPSLPYSREKILGFAFAQDNDHRKSMFRFAVNVEVYVHNEYTGKGVGKSLLDRMMFLLDPEYRSRDAVEWVVSSDRDIALQYAGGRRVVQHAYAWVQFESSDKARIVWISRWLEQFGFVKKAELDDSGFKNGKL